MAATTLQKYGGALALVGQGIDILTNSALTSPILVKQGSFAPLNSLYHITLLTKDELRSLTPEQTQKLTSLVPDTRHIFSAGVGGKPNAGVYWVVIIWAAGQQIRKQFGLAPKHFHITLSANDIHDVDKGITSLFPGQIPTDPSAEFLDHTIFTLHSFGQHNEAKDYSCQLILLDPESYKGFLRLGDIVLGGSQYKLAMLAYACAYERASADKHKSYCMKKLIECSKETEWGLVFQEHEITELEALNGISPFLLKPWSQALRETLSDQTLMPSLLLEPRQSLFIPSSAQSAAKPKFYKLPRFFRWLIPFHLAIMSTPRNEDDIMALASPQLGIRHVLTLTEETPLHESWFHGKRITNTFLPVPNFHPPTIEQMDLIIRLFDDQKRLPMLVHCGGGKGRAGTVGACYLAAFGFNKPRYEQDHPELTAAEAISSLRALRPGSLETEQQEAFVSKWCSTIWKRQSVYPDLPSEPPPSPMKIEGTLTGDVDLLVLVGLPGSGKSWFSKSLLARHPSGWIYISQDDSRSRASCETEIGRTPPRGKHVLLDRCNTSASDRKLWLGLASNWSVSPVCIWFDYDRELCTSRAQMRAGHPTLPPGSRVRNAVEQMQKIFVKPSLAEGFKAIITVRSFAAAQEAVLHFSSPVTILKFPRTPHLLDLGAATSDDVHADVSSFANIADESSGHVVITEKIDGANMGFSLSSSADGTSRILVQNRSHYVNSSTHEQFKKLGVWIDRHEEELKSILGRDPYFPERYILYGEWMYATHSIPYTHLPDYFIAYDLFDRGTRTWADTRTLHGLLEGTSISSVPTIRQGMTPTEADLLAMIQGKSSFYEGRMEGVYVKVEVNRVVKLRGKVVRSDFIAGNEHWTRGGIRVNGINLDTSTDTNSTESWRRIALQADWDGEPSPHIDHLHYALLHAQGCPLTISIFETPADKGVITDPSAVIPYLEIRVVHRAKRLELSASIVGLFTYKYEAFQAVEAKWAGEKPLLEELVFYRGSEIFPSLPPLNQAIAKIWTPSPKLHTLIIKTDVLDSWTSLVHRHYFPLHQLTTLEMASETTLVEFLAILSETNNLVRCKIGPIIGELPSDQTADKPLLLAALQDLDLSGVWDGENGPPLTILLGYIKAPALTSLSLLRDRDWSRPSFTSFIMNFACNIRHLTLDINISGEEGRVECLQLIPSLQSLSTRSASRRDDKCFTEIFTNAMKVWDTSKGEFCLFPKLESMETEYCVLAEKSGTTFADMIEARCRLPSAYNPLKQLTILGTLYYPSELEDEYSCKLIRLLTLKRDGLKLKFDPKTPVLQSVICR